jgi:predicted nucleic acid-binding protein
MVASALVDTGALLAILDRDDPWHARCVEVFESLTPPLLTSAAVLAELFHLLGANRRDVSAAWHFLRTGAVTVAAITDDDLGALAGLMDRYHDRPMDLADATLVHLAERESISTILTTDNDDFETYRIRGRRRFRVLPGRALA